jgi:hypothetical protein
MFDLGAFVQDDWRASQGLTLSAGLRWEGQTNTHDWHDAAPRLSFAWAPGRASAKGSPSTVIRGGLGMFYSRVSQRGRALYARIQRDQSTDLSGEQSAILLPGWLTGFRSIDLDDGVEPRPVHRGEAICARPYLLQSALGVERQVFRRTTLAVNLTDTHGGPPIRDQRH